MFDSANDQLIYSLKKEHPVGCDECLVETVMQLEELLVHSVLLRDLYKIARWQTCNGELCRMHQLFESHYKEQLHLVDVLIDRVRMLGGAGRVFACDFLKGSQFSSEVRGHRTPGPMVDVLLDTHELVLNVARPVKATEDHRWANEFAVGLVVLTNDLQSVSLGKQRLLQTQRRCVRTFPRKDEWT